MVKPRLRRSRWLVAVSAKGNDMADAFDRKAAKYNKEAKDVASGAGPIVLKPEEEDELRAARERQAMMKAPTTLRTMGRRYQKGGSVSSASSRADGIASKGKTRGRIC